MRTNTRAKLIFLKGLLVLQKTRIKINGYQTQMIEVVLIIPLCLKM